MTTTSDTPPVLGRYRLLTQALARHFSDRPTLHSVVSGLLVDALQKKRDPWSSPINLDHLKIIWTVDATERVLDVPRQQPLLEAVLEHIALGRPINYTFYEEEQCYLAELGEGSVLNEQTRPFLPMLSAEQAIRQVVLDWVRGYQQALVDYWNEPVEGYRSRQHWLGAFFGELILSSANSTPGLSDQQINAVRQVIKYPVHADRIHLLGRTRPRVYFAQVQSGEAGDRVEDLLPDLLVVHSVDGAEQLLVCMPSGQIESFATLDAYGRFLGRTLSLSGPADSRVWKRYEADGDCLQTQAMIELNTQLEAIRTLQEAGPQPFASIEKLARQLQRITDPAQVFGLEEDLMSEPLGRVFQALPDWLKNATVNDRFSYRSHMIDLGNVMRKANGRVFDEGIEDLHGYASRVLHEQMLKDQPLAPGYWPDDLLLDFTVATGPLGTAGLVETVRYTLTELALQNLIAVPSGHMTISHKHNQLIQDWWMTPAYIKTLIHKVDVGAQYPALIKRLLVDDPVEAARREVLFTGHLQVALAMLALEWMLKGQGMITRFGYRCIAALMQNDARARTVDGESVSIFPLALLSGPKAIPDFVRAMFVIGLTDKPFGRCVLYRPLFKDVLVEYSSAQAMLDALCRAGLLRDSVLDWLSDSPRAVHASGGLSTAHPRVDAHSFFYLRPMRNDFLHDVFREAATALVLQADRQSVSNAESRWASLKEGGWLLLNTVLPLMRGPVAVAGWLLLTVNAVQQDFTALASDEEKTKAPAIIDLLFNIALVLLHISQPATQGEPQDPTQVVLAEPALSSIAGAEAEPAPVNVRQGQVYFSDVPVGNNRSELNFAWFNNPMIHFTQVQLGWLELNRVTAPESRKPIEQGPLKGLYVIGNKWHALVRGFSYEVALKTEGVVVVSPANPLETGPWLKSDAAGVWDFDTGLHLRGGGPKKSPVRASSAKSVSQQVRELNEKYEALGLREPTLNNELNAARARVKEIHIGETLHSLTYLEKTVRIKHFRSLLEKAHAEYTLEHGYFKTRHALFKQPKDHLKEGNFNRTLFNIASDIAYSQHVFITVFIELYPEFLESTFETLSVHDTERFISMRRELFKAQSKHLEDFRLQVRSLQALRESPRVGFGYARESALKAMPKVSQADGTSRPATELDFLTTHLLTLVDIVPKTPFDAQWHHLGEIIWPLTFTVQAQAQLAEPDSFSHQERVEVLRDIHERYARAYDALAILHLEVGDQFNLVDYNRLVEMVQELSVACEEQLTEELRRENEWLPAQPGPSRTAQQTSRIIRTRKHGILIGAARSAHGAQVVEVGESVSDPLQRATSPGGRRSTLTFRESSPNQWEEVEPVVAQPVTRTLGAIRSQCNQLLDRVDPQINRVKVYAKNSRFPLELEEILERDALKLDGLIREIERDFPSQTVEKPKPGTAQSLLKRLREGAAKLRQQAIWVLKSLPPTEPVVDFLLKKNEVQLIKEGERVKMFGPRNDYVQEYQVLNKNNQVLWYAHLHYSQLNSATNTPTAAHFKLKQQRKVSKQSLEAKAKPGERVAEVYYGKISKKMINEYFIPLAQ